MGRLRALTRRGPAARPVLLLALLLVGPAAGTALFGWRSLGKDHELRLLEVDAAARDALERRVASVVADLERARAAEDTRDYFEYQREFLPRELEGGAFGFQRNMLADAGAERVRTWLEWELYEGKRTYGAPRVAPEGDPPAWIHTFQGDLRARLLGAPEDPLLRLGLGHTQRYALQVVAGNEERGKLQEELLDLRRQGALAQRVETLQEAPRLSPYLESFLARVKDGDVAVRYSPFRYLARPEGASGPLLLAWRLVWIPDAHAERREVRRDRWLVQAFVPDLGDLDARVRIEGTTELGSEAAPPPTTPDGMRVHRASLVEALDAEIARYAVADEPLRPAGELLLWARADPSVGQAAFRDARLRFLLLVGALFVVVGLGFVVLLSSLRRELALVRRKEDFMAAITHELKTPLTGIRMYADMLKAGWVGSPEAAERYADRILDESHRLGHLVEQVLDLAALERGIAQCHLQAGDLGVAVREAVRLMDAKAEKADVALSVDIADGLPEVEFDPRLVRALVLNLVDNAIKYSAKSEVREVGVSLARADERLVLAVTDRGAGIDPAVRKHVFEPFRRAGSELTRDAPGVGIGLALVKRYADAHRARVVLESTLGEGTTVRVRFPLPGAGA